MELQWNRNKIWRAPYKILYCHQYSWDPAKMPIKRVSIAGFPANEFHMILSKINSHTISRTQPTPISRLSAEKIVCRSNFRCAWLVQFDRHSDSASQYFVEFSQKIACFYIIVPGFGKKAPQSYFAV